MKNNKILILGASGFIGLNIIKKLSKISNNKVYGTYLKKKPKINNKKIIWNKIDLIKDDKLSIFF